MLPEEQQSQINLNLEYRKADLTDAPIYPLTIVIHFHWSIVTPLFLPPTSNDRPQTSIRRQLSISHSAHGHATPLVENLPVTTGMFDAVPQDKSHICGQII